MSHRYKLISTREEARRKGYTYYFTGTPCVNGHKAPRLVSNGKCTTCYNEWYETNKEKRRKKQKEHYENNKEQYIRNARKWEKENPTRAKEINRTWMREHRANQKQSNEG